MGTALVVGGSGGIGIECARELLALGHRVVLAARTEDKLRKVAEELGTDWVAADAVTEEGAAAVAAAVGQVDVFVHVAGVNPEPRRLTEETLERFDAVLDANLRSVFLTVRALTPQMNSGGRMIFVSSSSAARGLNRFGAYAASKGGLRALAGTLAAEVQRDGVNVSVLTPGPVDTAMFDVGPADTPLLDPRDVAKGIRYLAELSPGVIVEELVMRANKHHGVAIS